MVALGTYTPLQQAWFEEANIFVEVRVEGDVITPRQKLHSVAFALQAANAADVRNANINPRSISVGGQQVVNEDGAWVGASTGLQGPPGPPGPAGAPGAGHSLQCDVGQMIAWRNNGWACEAPPEQPNRGGVCYTALGVASCGDGFTAVMTGWQANYELVNIGSVNNSGNAITTSQPYCQGLPPGSSQPAAGVSYRGSRAVSNISDSRGQNMPIPASALRCAICCR
jgi:hypothetical protein